MTVSKNSIVVLYGPPGVGKLTVAKELHKITNLPLFHNHLSRDLVKSVFANNSEYKLIDIIRKDFFEFAAKNNLGLIFTFVYAHKTDDEFMDNIANIAKTNKSPIYFIQLLADEGVWKNRVENKDRLQYQKVVDFKAVKETMEKHDLFTPYTQAKNHKVINITKLNPEETANIIKDFISN